MVTEPSHSAGFARDAGSGGVIQFLCLDEGKGHIPVKEGIMREVDLFLAPFPEELFDLIAAISKRGRLT
jgi:hypothetical protein